MSRWESAVRVIALLLVGGIGAAAGFKHTHDWAVENGQSGWIAWAVAVVIECMVVVAGMELRRKRGTFPMVVLVGAFLLQMAAQVSSARDTVAGWLLAATPALGFLVIVKLVLRSADQPVPAQTSREAAVPVAATAQREHLAPVEPVEPVEPLREIAAQAAPVPMSTAWPPAS